LPLTFACSLVAVHGLNGSARETWTDHRTGKLWLEDFLPTSEPDIRVMTFGYSSGLAFSRSKAGIESFALDLLSRLLAVRAKPEVLLSLHDVTEPCELPLTIVPGD
jgi:hypothetical protein